MVDCSGPALIDDVQGMLMNNADSQAAKSERRIDRWFDRYAVCHTNHTNKLIHYICVPVITACVLGLSWAIPVTAEFGPWMNVATLVTMVATIFYVRLSIVLASGMLLCTLPILGLFYWMTISGNAQLVWQSSLVLFVAAWILQFIGHEIEGTKPAFLEDLQFLMIGPLWILARVMGRFGIWY